MISISNQHRLTIEELETKLSKINPSLNLLNEIKKEYKNQILNPLKKASSNSKTISLETYNNQIINCTNDILYLIKKSWTIQQIFRKILIVAQHGSLNPLFNEECSILLHSYPNQSFDFDQSMYYKNWLRQQTTYDDILAMTKKNDAGRRVYTIDNFAFILRKQTLQKIFLRASDIIKSSSNNGKIYKSSLNEYKIFFVITKQLNGKFNLFFSKTSPDYILGEGMYCIVQKIIDLQNGTPFAMKYPRQDNLDYIRYGTMTLQSELRCWNILNVNDQKFLNRPNAVVEDGFFNAIISKCYRGDGIKFLKNIQEHPNVSVKDVLHGMLHVLKGIHQMNSKKIAHCDLKPDNFLYEFRKKKLVFNLNDLGLSQIYENIIDGSQERYATAYRCTHDFEALKSMKQQKCLDECEKIIEKQEVYAFGVSVIAILLYQLIPPPIEEKENFIITNYGSNVYDFLKSTTHTNYRERPTLEEAICILENILIPQEEVACMFQSFAEVLKANESIENNNKTLI